VKVEKSSGRSSFGGPGRSLAYDWDLPLLSFIIPRGFLRLRRPENRWLQRPSGFGFLLILPSLQFDLALVNLVAKHLLESSFSDTGVIIHPHGVLHEPGELEGHLNALLLGAGQVKKQFPYKKIYKESTTKKYTYINLARRISEILTIFLQCALLLGHPLIF
jgi:hypothetical protein